MTAHKYHRSDYDPLQESPFCVDRQLLKLCEASRHVLEIGCATGYFGRALKKNRDVVLTGLERDPSAAQAAKPAYDQLIVGDIENPATQSELNGRYDAIVMAAVLFALRNPEPVLAFLRGRVKQGGFLLMTVPNVAHWSARQRALFGKFAYEPYGLFDDMTARFYTRRSVEELIDRAGWRVDLFSFDPDQGLPLIHGAVRRLPFVGFPLLRFFYGLAPTLWGYQFLYKLSPK